MTPGHGSAGGRRWAWIMAAAAALVVVGAIGALSVFGSSMSSDGAGAADPSTTEAVDESTTTATTTTVPAGSFPIVSEWTWTLRSKDGYLTSGRLSVGSISAAGDAPSLPGLKHPAQDLSQVCDGFDPATDALIPAKIVLRNDTTGFSNKLSNTFYLAVDDGRVFYKETPEGALSIAKLYSDGTKCGPVVTADDAFFSNGSGWGLSFEQPAEPGETLGPSYAMLILPNYYAPAHPAGDIARLSTIGLGIVGAMRSDGSSLTVFSGPDSRFGAALQGSGSFMLSSLAH